MIRRTCWLICLVVVIPVIGAGCEKEKAPQKEPVAAKKAAEPAKPTQKVEKVRDPVCNMKVDPTTASWTHKHEGKDYFFCAEQCKKLFSEDPAKYLDKKKKKKEDEAGSKAEGSDDHAGHAHP